MSFLSKLVSHDPVVRMLSGGDHDNNTHGSGGPVRLGYPMMPGETVSSVADRLRIPVHELLSSNPTLNLDTPLTPGLDIHLPTRNLDQTLSNILNLSSHDVPAPHAMTPPSSYELPVAPTLPSNAGNSHIPAANDLGNLDVRDPYDVLVGTSASTIGAASAADVEAGVMISSYALANSVDAAATRSTTAQVVPTQVPTPDRSSVVALPGNAKAGAANDEPMHTLSFNQAASTTIRNVQAQSTISQLQNSQLPPPPPMPPSTGTQAMPLVNTASMQTSWAPQNAPSAWATIVDVADGSQAKLQIIAMMAAAQMETAMAGSGAVAGQTPGFIDPQALAAYASRATAGRTIDLGSGRTLQFSLAADPMRRIGAIGEDQRAATAGTRRTGDGLDQVPQETRAEADEETRDGHQERDQERRRLAAVAALRRRRRPLSIRCRYRTGARQPLHASGGRYPSGVDLAEFRGRLPQRYLWTPAPGRD